MACEWSGCGGNANVSLFIVSVGDSSLTSLQSRIATNVHANLMQNPISTFLNGKNCIKFLCFNDSPFSKGAIDFRLGRYFCEVGPRLNVSHTVLIHATTKLISMISYCKHHELPRTNHKNFKIFASTYILLFAFCLYFLIQSYFTLNRLIHRTLKH